VIYRERNGKGCSFPLFALNVNGAIVFLYDLLANCKSEAGSSYFLKFFSFCSPESLKYVWQVFFANSDSGIFDRERNRAICFMQIDVYFPLFALRDILYGIANKINDEPLKVLFVACDTDVWFDSMYEIDIFFTD